MSVLAASKYLGVHRSVITDRIARGVIDAEINDAGHLVPLRESVERYKAAMSDKAAVAA